MQLPTPGYSGGLPPAFVLRMQALLGSEAPAFFAALEERERRGLRVNLLKLTAEDLAALVPWQLEPVPWCSYGFALPPDTRAGRHPFHAAGLYYLQEPSAMAVVEALDVRPGQRVLDLAAAPGGKATQIAALLQGDGVLLANEIEGSRLKALGENIERWGARNVLISNERPDRLAALCGASFDRLLLDAPCSGEGMFRRGTTARREWSVEHVGGCGARQAAILDVAARLVRPGGRLVYSTCTFAPEENEARVAAFLAGHPDWELVDILKAPGMDPGRPEWVGDGAVPLERAARIWPHRAPGDGHFLAALRRQDAVPSAEADLVQDLSRRTRGGRSAEAARAASDDGAAALRAWVDFEARALAMTLPPERIFAHGDLLYLRPEGSALPAGVRVVRPGLWLGTAKPGRFEPAHALALALGRGDVQQSLSLPIEATSHYLHGETLHAPGTPGWVLIDVEGWPIGWGKRVGDTVKNLYPKGLRWIV